MTSSSVSPRIFSPRLQQGPAITVQLTVRFTDSLGEQSPKENFRWFVRLCHSVKTASGQAVVEFTADHSLTPPARTPSQQSFTLQLADTWNGRTNAGAIPPDGAYSWTCCAELWREKIQTGGQLKLVGTTTARSATVTLDGSGPVVSNLAPPSNGIIDEHTPSLSASWTDQGAGINLQSAVIEFDGNAVTGQAQITQAGFSFTPGRRLADGVHTVRVAIVDSLGNPTEARWQFTVVSAVATIPAATGGTVEVTDPQGPFKGARLEFPPAAFAVDTVVTMSVPQTNPSMDEGLFNPAGAIISIDIVGATGAGALQTPALLTLPYDESPVLQRSLSEGVVRIYHCVAQPPPAVPFWQMLKFVSVDTQNNLVTAQVSSFSDFTTGIPVPANLAKVSGDNQLAGPNRPLNNPFVSKLTDRDGNPIGDWEVKYERTSGTGEFSSLAGIAAAGAGLAPARLGVQAAPGNPPSPNGWSVNGTGKRFEVKDANGATITLTSSETIHVTLFALAGILMSGDRKEDLEFPGRHTRWASG
jgi:hypothetical protein